VFKVQGETVMSSQVAGWILLIVAQAYGGSCILFGLKGRKTEWVVVFLAGYLICMAGAVLALTA